MCARETFVGFPLRVQSPARRRPVLRCKTVPTRKALQRKGLVGAAQISGILEENLGSLVGQGFRDFSQ